MKKVQVSCAYAFSTAADELNQSVNNAMNIAQIAQNQSIPLDQIQGLSTSLVSPLLGEIILRALSIEIALKLIIEHSGKRVLKTHDLSKLWDDIPCNIRKRLENHFNEQITIKQLLDSSKSPFIDWRYLYEASNTINFQTRSFSQFNKILLQEIYNLNSRNP